MENYYENTSGLDLAESIKASLTSPKHRFEFYDPFMETKRTFKTSHEAIAEADKLGATTFQSLEFNGELSNIKKTNNEWIRIDNDEPIADIQAKIDQASLTAIKDRAEKRMLEIQGNDATTDTQMAQADAIAFQRIQDPNLQEQAAVVMAENSREYPDYLESLTARFTGYPATAQLIEDLDAAHSQKMETMRAAIALLQVMEPTKEEAKAAEIATKADKAKATPEAPASESNVTPKKTRKTSKKTQPEKPQLDTLDPAALALVSANRERDRDNALKILGSNSIEPDFEKQKQSFPSEADAKREAWLKQSKPVEEVAAQSPPSDTPPSNNKVEADEIFTANKSEIKPIVPPEIEKRFLRVGDKFYHPKNTDLVAFEDKGNKLETKSNSENIAQTMVLIAEARGWDEIKVSGTESFRKEVWREAASRGMHVKGYTPTEQDKAALNKQISTSEANKVEPDNKPFRARENAEDNPNKNPFREIVDHGAAKYLHDKKNDNGEISHYETKEVKRNSWTVKMAETFAKKSPAEAVKQHPELAGAAAIVDALDKKAKTDGLTGEQRDIVNARIHQNVVNSIECGDIPKVKIREIEAKHEKEQDR